MPPISINQSKALFFHDNYVENVLTIAARHDVPTHLLHVEVTESMAWLDEEAFIRTLDALRRAGIGLSLDDFGKGYSSMAMLHSFGFDTIKLDRKVFYGEKGFDDESKHIVSTLISLSHDLGKNVVSEGIETQEQVQFLRDRRCDMIQGFYYSRPMPKEDYWKRLTETEGEKSKK